MEDHSDDKYALKDISSTTPRSVSIEMENTSTAEPLLQEEFMGNRKSYNFKQLKPLPDPPKLNSQHNSRVSLESARSFSDASLRAELDEVGNDQLDINLEDHPTARLLTDQDAPFVTIATSLDDQRNEDNGDFNVAKLPTSGGGILNSLLNMANSIIGAGIYGMSREFLYF